MPSQDPISEYLFKNSLSREMSARIFAILLGVDGPMKPANGRYGCRHCVYLCTRMSNRRPYDLYFCTSARIPIANDGADPREGYRPLENLGLLKTVLVQALERSILSKEDAIYGLQYAAISVKDYMGGGDG